MRVLGLSCFYHDAAVCLIDEGRIVAAATEESFSRKKHDSSFPTRAANYALREGGITAGDLSAVIFYDKPMKKLDRSLRTHLDQFPFGLGPFIRKMPHVFGTELRLAKVLREEIGFTGPLLYSEHHLSHAASAFFASGWEEAAILTVDGVGEWATSTWGVGRGNNIELAGETRFPHSLGLLYSAITFYLGFKVNSAEYKVMGLAPYGQPRFVEQMRKLIHIADDGSFRLDMSFFDFERGQRMYNARLEELFGRPTRPLEAGELDSFHHDVARSLQVIVDEVMVKLATHIVEKTGLTRLCLAGGVALNCVANGEVLRRSPVTEIFVQPSAGDAGGAMGAALQLWNGLLQKPRLPRLESVYLGPGQTTEEVRATLDAYGAKYVELDREALLARSVELLASSKVVGWHHGRMEWGPRALGHRSILGDPRVLDMRDVINRKIKMREGFRPFAPSVLEDKVSEWFEMDCPSPYMLLVAPVRAGKTPLPSITHVDNSARVQTISREQDALYYDLIAAFGERTGVPVVINTSMNVRGEPMVNTADDTYRCFMRTGMDALVIERFVLLKEEQPPLALRSARDEFGLD